MSKHLHANLEIYPMWKTRGEAKSCGTDVECVVLFYRIKFSKLACIILTQLVGLNDTFAQGEFNHFRGEDIIICTITSERAFADLN